MTGIITNIQGYCIHDGPGIRTTVFLKGCQLNCLWCCNPETQGDAKVAPGKAPKNQPWFFGHEIEAKDLVTLLLKDRAFYDNSGGGVTISGGDPIYQPDFTFEICHRLKAEGIHVAMDTYGYCSWDTLKLFLPVVDLWLYDIKSLDKREHIKYTGVSRLVPMKNLMALNKAGANVKIRIAIIPGFNDSQEDIEMIIGFLQRTRFRDISLFAYHVYGMRKYKLLGRKYQMSTENMPESDLAWIEEIFIKNGYTPTIGY